MTLYRTTVSAGEGMDFVLSDGTLDRHGTRINPRGWEVGKYLPALFGHAGIPIGQWENVRVEGERLLGRLAMAAKGTSARIDELRSLVEQGILRAVSVGFEVLDYGKPGQTEFDIERQSLVEASLVTIPSNPNALAQARALNISESTLGLVFGEQAARPAKSNGRHAATSPINGNPKMDISTRIETAQADLNAARDALTAHLKDDNADTEQTNVFSTAIQEREKKLASLEQAEKALAVRAGETAPVKAELPKRKPLGMALKDTSPRDHFIRAASVHLLSYMTRQPLEQVLEQRYGEYRDYEYTQIMTRAAVAAATTTTAGWAAELVQTATTEFLSNLNADAVFPRLAALGTQMSFGPNAGAIKIPSRATTPSIGGSFVAEGGVIPVRRLGLTSITLTPHKIGVISVFTREIMRYSNPTIESIVREAINEDTQIMIDSLLLDATASSATRPAGLLFGVSATTASAAATAYAKILADLKALSSPFYAVNAGRKLVLLVNPANALELSMAPGPDGTFGWVNGITQRFTILESTNVTLNKVIMIDAADLVSVLGAPEFELSEQATLHMEDTTPLAIGTAGSPATVAAPASSMFQEAKVALRMLLDANWAMRRTGMVQYITTVSWS
jgi:HK97 family phage major capsid protein